MRSNIPEPWLKISKKYGSVNNMCKVIGIPPRTFANWVRGIRKPQAAGVRLLDLFLEIHGFPPFSPPPPDHESAFEPTSDDIRTLSKDMSDE